MYYQLTTGKDRLTYNLLELLSALLPGLEVVKNDRRALVKYLAEKKDQQLYLGFAQKEKTCPQPKNSHFLIGS